MHFTNLLGLFGVNKALRKLFKRVPRTKEWEEENVVAFYKIVEEFYDFIIPTIKSYSEFFVKKTLTIQTARKNNSYLLFRPVGLKLLARLYVHYYQKSELDALKSKVNSISFIAPNTPFKGILWNNGKMEAKEKNQSVAFDVALYILNEMPKQEVKEFTERYREIMKDSKASLPQKLT